MSEVQYLNLLRDVLENGVDVSDRTGVGTRSVFGRMLEFDLQVGFPALSTKKLAWKSVVSELLWFLEGSTDERRLAEILYKKNRYYLVDKTTIWTANADKQGAELGYENNVYCKELGPVYGRQWRDFGGIDQINRIINQLKSEPDSRRIMLSAWNVEELHRMALPPCHYGAQFRVYDGTLSCLMTQRSVDSFLGLPFNIASYALLTHLLARETNLQVGELIMSLGDVHIYNNHIEQVKEQLSREPFPFPQLKIDEEFSLRKVLDNYNLEPDEIEATNDVDYFTLENYQHHPSIKADMAV